jgi:hypothetical protein
MQRPTILFALGLAVAAAPNGGQAGTDAAFSCRNDEHERRVELQHADRPSRLPCEVVYWRDFTRGGDGQPIWRAQSDFEFCVERTHDLVQRLQAGGWSCTNLAPEHPPPKMLPTPAPHELVPPDPNRMLDQALARDLKRLAELSPTSGIRFEVASAKLGDLDQDGDEDAAVLLNYLSEHPGTAQFLMAYRFDGATFQPSAKMSLGGLGTEVRASAIERINEGVIELLLQVGDECCPSSGDYHRAYVLEEGHLIELRPGS